jgi:hypothetical protein
MPWTLKNIEKWCSKMVPYKCDYPAIDKRGISKYQSKNSLMIFKNKLKAFCFFEIGAESPLPVQLRPAT